MSLTKTSIGAAVLGLLAAGAATAAEPEDLIKYRQGVMKSLGGHMSATALIVRGKVPYGARLEAHARGLAALSEDLAALFPEGSDFGETGAKAEVWSKREGFEKASADAARAAQALVTAAGGKDSGAIARAFDGVGKTCKGCHDDYRKED
jgi:cytochrome c556